MDEIMYSFLFKLDNPISKTDKIKVNKLIREIDIGLPKVARLQRHMKNINIAALTLPIIPGGEQVIIPSGIFDAPNGSLRGAGPWELNNDNGAKLALLLNNPMGIDIVVDYEHQTILSEENGKPAPAAGWLMRGGFEWRENVGLVATSIRWTNDAAEYIQEGKYRYLSPVFTYGPDKIPLNLLSVGLTNTPALTQLQELVIAANNRGYKMTENQEVVQPPVIAQPEVAPPVVEVAATSQPVTSQPKPSVEAKAQSSLHTMIAALTSQISSLSVENAQLKVEVNKLQHDLNDSAKESVISAALSIGQIVPGMETWLRSMDMETLSNYISKQPPIAALSSTQTQGKAPTKIEESVEGLCPEELSICSQLGINTAAFTTQKNSMKEMIYGRA